MSFRILVTVTINGTEYRVSNKWFRTFSGVIDFNQWDGYIQSFDPIRYQIDQDYGGFIRIRFGSITFSPGLFEDEWPPPNEIDVSVSYMPEGTTSEVSSKVFLFEAKGYRDQRSIAKQDFIKYKLYGEIDSTLLLDEGPGFDKNSIDIVRAGVYKWTASGSGTNEYRLEIDAGGDPGINEPTRVTEGVVLGQPMTVGTVGSLAVGEWDWGDNDALGYSTVYVRIVGEGDPDAEARGYLRADYVSGLVTMPRSFGEVLYEIPRQLPNLNGTQTYWKSGFSGTIGKEITAVANNGSGIARVETAGAHGFSTGNSVTVETSGPTDTYNTEDTITDIDATHFDMDNTAFVATAVGHAWKAGYWRVYDAGVPITGTVTNNGDGSFSVTGTPQDVRIGGTGLDTTLLEVYTWAVEASRLNLSLDSTAAVSPSPDLAYYEEEQKTLIDFLSEIAAFSSHMSYISTDLFLVGMTEDNGTATPSGDFDMLDAPLGNKPPISQVKSDFIVKTFAEIQSSKQVKEETDSVSVKTSLPYGRVLDVKPYHNLRDNIEAAITAIQSNMTAPEVDMIVPINDIQDYTFGMKLTWTDTNLDQSVTSVMRIRTIQYNIDELEATLEADGSIS